ncbi:UDP-N-acetylmuramate dehydrogenase [Candidatus Roizmanbacteria bacterium]|nr:UDP-N-acetylmuramate dehydrogenase [Candidatus Roizmanbacteria bacterium]
MSYKQQLEDILGEGRIQEQKELTSFFTIHVPVKAEYYFEAETKEDILNAIGAVHSLRIPIKLIGGGSNFAVTTSLIKGLVVRNMYHKKEIEVSGGQVKVRVSSGYPLSRLIQELVREGIGGLEYHMGLPGTVGGAVAMNSNWANPMSFVGDHLIEATLVDEKGNIKKVDHDYFRFRYDYSTIKISREIILECVFKLVKGDSVELQEIAAKSLEHRKQTQPAASGSSGCFFQNLTDEEQEKFNLPTKSAGYLIDKAGLKNAMVGKFVISPVHANFILNTGGGTPQELGRMIELVKKTVYEKFGIMLREEVEVI